MYCPNCAAKNNASQRFCRACGLNLERITDSLAEQKRLDSDSHDLAKSEKVLQRLGIISFGGLSVIFLFGLGYMFARVFVKMVLSGSTSHVILGILGMLGIICALAGSAFVIINETLKKKAKEDRF